MIENRRGERCYCYGSWGWGCLYNDLGAGGVICVGHGRLIGHLGCVVGDITPGSRAVLCNSRTHKRTGRGDSVSVLVLISGSAISPVRRSIVATPVCSLRVRANAVVDPVIVAHGT